VDTITHDRMALTCLVERVGADNVAMGTDLPFDMATLRLEEAVDDETAHDHGEHAGAAVRL
jgi:hypothetical protein